MEQVEPVLKNIYQSNIYGKDLCWPHFDDEPRAQEKQQVKDQQSCIFFFVAHLTIPSRTRGNSPDVTTVFDRWVYGRFIEKQSNLRRKKLSSNFFGASFSNRGNVSALIQFRREGQPWHLKR